MTDKSLATDSYFELRFSISSASYQDTQAQLKLFLMDCGILGETVAYENSPEVKAVMIYLNDESQCGEIERVFEKNRENFPNVSISRNFLKVEDWRDKWKEDYHISDFGSRFSVVPIWEKEKFTGTRIPLYIEPGSAFGSGCHETTRIMVELMESVEGEFKTFLDIGTGTGILSIAGKYLGADVIDAFDRDKPSVEFAIKNFEMNHKEGASFLCRELAKIEVSKTYDFVGANVLSKVLLKYQEKIQSFVTPGKYLAVSGIHSENVESFLQDLNTTDFKKIKEVHLNGWFGALYRKSPK